MAGGRRQGGELVRRVVFRDRRMGHLLGLEVLPDGQQIAAGLPEVGERPQDVGPALAEPDHEARFGQGTPCFRRGQDPERAAIVLPGAADGRIQGFGRLEIVVEDVRPGGEDYLERRRIALEIGDERLDPGGRAFRANGDDGREVSRPAVGEIVAGHRCDHGVGQAERGHGLGDMKRFRRVRGERSPLGNGAEAAVAGAGVPEDEESGRLALPALADVRTSCALADRVQVSGLEDLRDTRRNRRATGAGPSATRVFGSP